MIALSIRQPWAWLIVRPDLTDPRHRADEWQDGSMKDVENRSWNTKFRGRFLIHASAGMTVAEYDEAFGYAYYRGVALPAPKELLRGGLVGTATLTDVLTPGSPYPSAWYEDQFGFVLDDPQPMKFTQLKGRLGFFNVPDAALPTSLPAGAR